MLFKVFSMFDSEAVVSECILVYTLLIRQNVSGLVSLCSSASESR